MTGTGHQLKPGRGRMSAFHPKRTLSGSLLPLTVEQPSSGIPSAWTKTSST